MANDHWNTPPEVLDRVRAIATIALDPCSNPTSQVVPCLGIDRSARAFGPRAGLDAPWAKLANGRNGGLRGPGLVYCNPPYSTPAPWITKCVEESSLGAEIVLLVPSDSGTRWFQEAWRSCDAVCLPDHRLAFLDARGKPVSGNRGSSAIFYFGDRAKRFLAAFDGYGVVVVRTRPPRRVTVVRAEAAE